MKLMITEILSQDGDTSMWQKEENIRIEIT